MERRSWIRPTFEYAEAQSLVDVWYPIDGPVHLELYLAALIGITALCVWIWRRFGVPFKKPNQGQNPP